MTSEQKAEVLAALDAYAEVFGPRLATGCLYDNELDCCCALGVLGLFVSPSEGFFNWDETARHFGFEHAAEVYTNNDSGPYSETPVGRFIRVRRAIANYPVTA